MDIDTPLNDVRTKVKHLMQQPNRPDGVICGGSAAAIALVAGIEAAGLTVGMDIDVAAKQSTDILPWFRPQLIVVTEDFKLAGLQLGHAVLARLAGGKPQILQTIG